MTRITDFFKNLNNQIKNAQNRSALKFIKNKADRFKFEHNQPNIDRKIKVQVNKNYSKSMKLLRRAWKVVK